MNLTHKVQDIRNFINAFVHPSSPFIRHLLLTRAVGSSRPENLTRPYTIGTTFPNRVLEADEQTVEAAGLVNSVVVQRWV
jgi:UBX domain-containing protein 1